MVSLLFFLPHLIFHLFLAALGLHRCAQTFSNCSEHGLLIAVASLVAEHRLSCPEACGIFPDQGWNSCPLHWRQIFTHWATGDVPAILSCILFFCGKQQQHIHRYTYSLLYLLTHQTLLTFTFTRCCLSQALEYLKIGPYSSLAFSPSG